MKTMRNILFAFFLILVVAVFLGWGLIQSDWFWKKILPQYFAAHNIFKITSIDYESKSVSLNGNLSFRGLKLLIQKDRLYEISISKLDFFHLWIMMMRRGHVDLQMADGFVYTTEFSFQHCDLNADFEIQPKSDVRIDGKVVCADGELSRDKISKISGNLEGAAGWLALDNFQAEYRQGKITGRMTFGLNAVAPYVLDLRFENVVLDQDVFDGNVLGKVSGTLQANGFSKQLNDFTVLLDAPEGSKIRADLLQSIVPYLPAKSAAKQDLDAIIKVGGYVYCEMTHAVIKRVDEHKIVAEMNLKTNRLSLVLNPTVDINIEGGLQSVFKMLEFFSNPHGQEAL